MYAQGTVLDPSAGGLADGSTATLNFGRSSELIVSELNGKYFEHAYRGSVEPWEVHNLCSSLEVDYGVPFLWAGGASAAGLLVGSACARIWEQAQIGGPGEKKAVKRGIAEHLPWCGTVAKAGST